MLYFDLFKVSKRLVFKVQEKWLKKTNVVWNKKVIYL